ncbi:hypothetical protein [Rhodococcus sp. USK13]|uniref:hypothetical protein n=1 Tax=Rhodococcus sp. USK13 TaxID=2806442 RepID=UPI001BCCCDB1|nr:hypothetical protein [Rhodococcus sp. USK13]
MNRTDRQIAQFVVMWAPFGWPPEDKAFVEFGLTSERLYARCIEIIAVARRNHDLAHEEKTLVSRLAAVLMRRRVARLAERVA